VVCDTCHYKYMYMLLRWYSSCIMCYGSLIHISWLCVCRPYLYYATRTKRVCARTCINTRPFLILWLRAGAMASGLHVEIAFADCVSSKNGTHGIAVAGRAKVTATGLQVKSNKQLGLLIQSGAQAEISSSTSSKNGAHGICLQLGGTASLQGCKVTRNKQTGLAVMGVGSRARARELTTSDNGIDGCHVGQGAQLDVHESVMEKNQRMGLSALGSDTHALVQGCVITGSGEHGIAQGQGAEVRVAANTVKDNKDKDIFGNVHGAASAKRPAMADAEARHGGVRKEPGRSHEDTPLLGAATSQAPVRIKRIRIILLVVAAVMLTAGALYAYLSHLHSSASN
jgi:hypothetical protein